MKQYRTTGKQDGVALIVCLIMLLLIGLVATAGSQVGQLELFMAGNSEAKSDAMQRSLAAVDAVLEEPDDYLPVTGDIGHVICKVGDTCDADLIDLASSHPQLPDQDKYTSITVTRAGPLETPLPVMDENNASSGVAYKGARFEVTAEYDDSASGLGKARVTQGVMYRIAAPTQ